MGPGASRTLPFGTRIKSKLNNSTSQLFERKVISVPALGPVKCTDVPEIETSRSRRLKMALCSVAELVAQVRAGTQEDRRESYVEAG